MNVAEKVFLDEAALAWKYGQDNLKEFASLCVFVSGKYTKELADRCNLSVDAVEGYRKAYRLYYENIESDLYRKLWDELNISLWITAAKSKNPKRMEYLLEAYERKYTVEQFRAVLAVGEKPEWTLRIKQVVGLVQKLYGDFKPELEPEKREPFEAACGEFREACNKFYKAIEELAK